MRSSRRRTHHDGGMTWRERIRRAGRTILRPVARAVRGDSEELSPSLPSIEQAGAGPDAGTAEAQRAADAEPTPARANIADTAVPAWGLLPSQVPPRVELLRGNSSTEILKKSWGSVVQVTVMVAVLGTLYLLDRQDDIPLFWIVPITLLVGGVQFAALGYRICTRARAEHRAGYTVWRRREPQLPQADARTGYVIRPAGAPVLSKQQEAAELKRVREIGRFVARYPRTLGDPAKGPPTA
jgi:hypothetical protein